MHAEFLFHTHLMCLNRFDTYIQFSRQFRNGDALPMKEKISSSRSLKSRA